jgi:hypothetical protein
VKNSVHLDLGAPTKDEDFDNHYTRFTSGTCAGEWARRHRIHNDGVRVRGEQCMYRVYNSGAHSISILICVCVRLCVCSRTHAGMLAHASVCVRVCVCVYSRGFRGFVCMQLCACACACAYAIVRVYACMYERLCICACDACCVSVCFHVCVCM